MFGLMRPERSCSNKTSSDYRYHRMHYCGTCKTMGQQYGQRTRSLLNFDTVFFAEILSQLSNENLSQWSDGYQAINRCFTMPEQESALPLSLQYAAATNILLGELKSDDNIKDISGMRWKLVRQFLSKSFRKANQQFKEWGVDTKCFWHWVEKQDKLEKAARINFDALDDLLDHYAAPTAHITASIFKNGAKVVGRTEQELVLYNLGYQFGRLVYILDAFEDVEKDLFHQQFNPLAPFFDAKETLREDQLEKVRQVILDGQEAVADQIKKLPFSTEAIEHYTVRLYSNITLRIYKERKAPQKVKEQLPILWKTIKSKTSQLLSPKTSWARNLNYYLVSAILFVLPVAADYISDNNEVEVYKWMAIFTAALAGIGLSRYAIAKENKQKTKRKIRQAKRLLRKGKRKMRRLLKRVRKLFTKKRDCWGDCCTACCESCFEEMCSSCCDYICDTGCGNFCDAIADGKIWPWIVILLTAMLLTSMIVFLIV